MNKVYPSLTVTEQFLLISFDETTGDIAGKRISDGFITALIMDLEIDGVIQVVGSEIIVLLSSPGPRNLPLAEAYRLITQTKKDIKQVKVVLKDAAAHLLPLAVTLLIENNILHQTFSGPKKYVLHQPALRKTLLQDLRNSILSGNISEIPTKFLAILVFTTHMLPLVIPNKKDLPKAQVYLKTLSTKNEK